MSTQAISAKLSIVYFRRTSAKCASVTWVIGQYVVSVIRSALLAISFVQGYAR
jgi:hypothetical protein